MVKTISKKINLSSMSREELEVYAMKVTSEKEEELARDLVHRVNRNLLIK